MKFRVFIKHVERETLLFVSLMLFGGILLPTFIMLMMNFFSDVPQTESIFDGYRYLFEFLGGAKWTAVAVITGPYILFQCFRSIRWVVSTAKQHQH